MLRDFTESFESTMVLVLAVCEWSIMALPCVARTTRTLAPIQMSIYREYPHDETCEWCEVGY